MTLDQIGGLLSLEPVIVKVHHAADSGAEAFRSKARDYLAKTNNFGECKRTVDSNRKKR